VKFSKLIINGKVIDDGYQKVSALSPSFQYGLTVFEGIRGYYLINQFNFFLLEKHLQRLLLSGHLIGFKNLPEFSELISDINLLKENCDFKEDIYIKFILCFIGSGNWSQQNSPDRVCFAYPLSSCFRDNQPFSADAKISSINRITSNTLPPKIKCGANYINSRLAFIDVNSNKYDDSNFMPIMLDQNGYLTESSGSCVFVIKGNKVKTPPLFRNILNSITREFIIERILSKNKEIEFKEESLDRWDLFCADAVFLCGTNAEITLLNSLNGYHYNVNNEIIKFIFNSMKNFVLV
tara:strand:- start:415 stop:1296 length:882 start_codon:yes stop_codon:yes gene_type:complete